MANVVAEIRGLVAKLVAKIGGSCGEDCGGERGEHVGQLDFTKRQNHVKTHGFAGFL